MAFVPKRCQNSMSKFRPASSMRWVRIIVKRFIRILEWPLAGHQSRLAGMACATVSNDSIPQAPNYKHVFQLPQPTATMDWLFDGRSRHLRFVKQFK